eukprot:CAMPEP_0178397650 /NCGR_PEP_ID=MMETSP0689_2-20121128/14357_1 /TAXON_ID=160604 /ORGANISM="Amphidinium massartii, Strain CS-259" /LENGTH=132 /DNA_ID=CAMNT_0020018369 /DNA_START=1242 /DNA_END=1641 /DNA_ORIENTATION=-
MSPLGWRGLPSRSLHCSRPSMWTTARKRCPQRNIEARTRGLGTPPPLESSTPLSRNAVIYVHMLGQAVAGQDRLWNIRNKICIVGADYAKAIRRFALEVNDCDAMSTPGYIGSSIDAQARLPNSPLKPTSQV